MTNLHKVFLCLLSILLIECSSIKKKENTFKEDRLTMSVSGGESFSYESDNPNLVCLAFLNNFKDSIVVFRNNFEVLNFKRNDTVSYKEMKHEEIFKTIELDTSDSINKIEIFLLKERSKISFNLKKDKSLYLISRYNKSWYVTIWDSY